VTRRVQSFHFDVLAWCGSDFFAILATDDGERVAFENFGIAAGVVVVAGWW
jgi:hypothetical protein